MRINVTPGAVTTVQEGFLDELRLWKTNDLTLANKITYGATRKNEQGGTPITLRFDTHAERLFHVQNAAIRAGLNKLFAAPDIGDLLPMVEDEPTIGPGKVHLAENVEMRDGFPVEKSPA